MRYSAIALSATGSTGTSRVLPPLPVTRSTVSDSRGQIGAGEAERFGNAQAGAVEQRQHGGVAGGDPGLFGQLAFDRDDLFGVAAGQWFWQRFRLARRAQRCGASCVGEPTPFEKTQQRADAGQPAAKRAGAGAGVAAGGEKAAQIGRAQIGDVGNAGRAAAMAGEEMQELARVALIGLDGLGRQPAFRASIFSQLSRAA